MKIVFVLPFLLASTAGGAFVVPLPSCLLRPATTKLNLIASVEAAIADAQRICAADATSQECKVAWDIVEELEAADSHKAGVEPQQSSSSSATGTTTDVSAFLGGFDILVQKIDGKMDQLKATTIKMAEMGASDPSIEALYQRADEMKQALVTARESLRQ